MGNTTSFASALLQIEGVLLKTPRQIEQVDEALRALARLLPYWQDGEEGLTRFPLVGYKNTRLLDALFELLAVELTSVDLEAKEFSGLNLERLIVIAECLEKALSSKALYKHLPASSCNLAALALAVRAAFRMPIGASAAAFALLPRFQLQVLAVVMAVIERVGFEEAKEQSKEHNQVKREAAAKTAFLHHAGGAHALLECLACLHAGSHPLIVDALMRALLSIVGTHQDTTSFETLQILLSALRPTHGLLWHFSRSDFPRLRVSASALLKALFLESSLSELSALQFCALEWGALLWHFRLSIAAAPCESSAAAREKQDAEEFLRCNAVGSLLASFPATPAASSPSGSSALAAKIPLHLSVPLPSAPARSHHPLARAASREMVALLCLRNAKALGLLRRMVPNPLLRILFNDNPALLKPAVGKSAVSASSSVLAAQLQDRVVVDAGMFVSPAARAARGEPDKINGDLAASAAAASVVSARKKLGRGMSSWLASSRSTPSAKGGASAAKGSQPLDDGHSFPLFSTVEEGSCLRGPPLWTREQDMPVGVGPKGAFFWDLRISALPLSRHQRMLQADKTKVKLLGIRPTKSAAATHWRPEAAAEGEDKDKSEGKAQEEDQDKDVRGDEADGSPLKGSKRTKRLASKSTRFMLGSPAAALTPADAAGVISLQHVGGLRFPEFWDSLLEGKGFEDSFLPSDEWSPSAAVDIDRNVALRAALAGGAWTQQCLAELRSRLLDAEAGLDKRRRALRRDLTATFSAHFNNSGNGNGVKGFPGLGHLASASKTLSSGHPRGEDGGAPVTASLVASSSARDKNEGSTNGSSPLLTLVELSASLFLPGSPYINGGLHPVDSCCLIPDARAHNSGNRSHAANNKPSGSRKTLGGGDRQVLLDDTARKGVGSMTAADVITMSGSGGGGGGGGAVSSRLVASDSPDTSGSTPSSSTPGVLSSLRGSEESTGLAASLLAVPSLIASVTSNNVQNVPLLPLPAPDIPFDHATFELPLLAPLAQLLTISGVWLGPLRQYLLSLASVERFDAAVVPQGLSLPPGFPLSLWHAMVAMTVNASGDDGSAGASPVATVLFKRKVMILSTLRLLAQIALPHPPTSGSAAAALIGAVFEAQEEEEASIGSSLAKGGNATRAADGSLAKALGISAADFGGDQERGQQQPGAVAMLLWIFRELEDVQGRIQGSSRQTLLLSYREELVLLLRAILTQHSAARRLIHPLLPQQPQPLLFLLRLLLIGHEGRGSSAFSEESSVRDKTEKDWTVAPQGCAPCLSAELLSLAAAEALLAAVHASPSLTAALATPEAMRLLVASLLQDAVGAGRVKAVVLKLLRFAFLSISSSPLVSRFSAEAAREHCLVKALLATGASGEGGEGGEGGKGALSTDAAVLLQRLHVAVHDERSGAVLLGEGEEAIATSSELPPGIFAAPSIDIESKAAEAQSTLAGLLPAPLISLLLHKGHEAFLEVFNVQTHFASATLLWSTSMRSTLVESLKGHADIKALSGWGRELAAAPALLAPPQTPLVAPAAIVYPQLASCPQLEGIFLQAFVAGAAAPADLTKFLRALATDLHRETRLLASAHHDLVTSQVPLAATSSLVAVYDQQHERCLLFLRSFIRIVRESPGTRVEPSTYRCLAVLLGLAFGRYPKDGEALEQLHPENTAYIAGRDTQSRPPSPAFVWLLLPSSAALSSQGQDCMSLGLQAATASSLRASAFNDSLSLLVVALELINATFVPHGQPTPSKKAIATAADAKLLSTLLQFFAWITPAPLSGATSKSNMSITSASCWSSSDCVRGFLFAPCAALIARLFSAASETDVGAEWFIESGISASSASDNSKHQKGFDISPATPFVRAVGLLAWAGCNSALSCESGAHLAAPGPHISPGAAASALLRIVPACLQVLANLSSVFAMRRPLLDTGVVPVLLWCMTAGPKEKDAADAAEEPPLEYWALRVSAEDALRLLSDKTLHSGDDADDSSLDAIAAGAAAAMSARSFSAASSTSRTSMAAAAAPSLATLRASTMSAAHGPMAASSRKLSLAPAAAEGGGKSLASFRSLSIVGSFAAAAQEKSVRTAPPQPDDLQATSAVVQALCSMVTPPIAALILSPASASAAPQTSAVASSAELDAFVRKENNGVRSALPLLVFGRSQEEKAASFPSFVWRLAEEAVKLRDLLRAEILRLEALSVMVGALPKLTMGVVGGIGGGGSSVPLASPNATSLLGNPGKSTNPFVVVLEEEPKVHGEAAAINAGLTSAATAQVGDKPEEKSAVLKQPTSPVSAVLSSPKPAAPPKPVVAPAAPIAVVAAPPKAPAATSLAASSSPTTVPAALPVVQARTSEPVATANGKEKGKGKGKGKGTEYGDSDDWEREVESSMLEKTAAAVMQGFGVDMDELKDDTVGSKADPDLKPPKPLSETRRSVWPPQKHN